MRKVASDKGRSKRTEKLNSSPSGNTIQYFTRQCDLVATMLNLLARRAFVAGSFNG